MYDDFIIYYDDFYIHIAEYLQCHVGLDPAEYTQRRISLEPVPTRFERYNPEVARAWFDFVAECGGRRGKDIHIKGSQFEIHFKIYRVKTVSEAARDEDEKRHREVAASAVHAGCEEDEDKC